MSVPRNSVYAWPESVAFKRMVRGLIRGQEYVPPQQPIGDPPDGTVPAFVEPSAITGAVSEDAATDPPGDRPSTRQSIPDTTVGDWTLQQNDRGDLVARHVSGQETVLAPRPEGGTNG